MRLLKVIDVQDGHARVRYDGAKKSDDEWILLQDRRIFEEKVAYEAGDCPSVDSGMQLPTERPLLETPTVRTENVCAFR